MRKLFVFLFLGVILAFLILEYMVQDQERRLKSRVRPVSPVGEANQPEKVAVNAARRQWQGTDVAAPTTKDDLTLINGIGPAFEKALNALGIRTFAQLAEQDADDLASRIAARVTPERIRRDRWIEQAHEFARSS